MTMLYNNSHLFSNSGAFVTLKGGALGHVWGDVTCGGKVPQSVAKSLTKNVHLIYSTWRAFAALKRDGSVHAWGALSEGGSLTKKLNGIHFICSNHVAFVAFEKSGTPYTWGHSLYGGVISKNVSVALAQANATFDNCPMNG